MIPSSWYLHPCIIPTHIVPGKVTDHPCVLRTYPLLKLESHILRSEKSFSQRKPGQWLPLHHGSSLWPIECGSRDGLLLLRLAYKDCGFHSGHCFTAHSLSEHYSLRGNTAAIVTGPVERPMWQETETAGHVSELENESFFRWALRQLLPSLRAGLHFIEIPSQNLPVNPLPDSGLTGILRFKKTFVVLNY